MYEIYQGDIIIIVYNIVSFGIQKLYAINLLNHVPNWPFYTEPIKALKKNI